MTDIPEDYWCAMPLMTNISEEELKNFTIPYNITTGFDKCHRYKIDWTMLLMENITSLEPNTSWPLESCLDGWNFKGLDVNSSIVTQVMIPSKSLASRN